MSSHGRSFLAWVQLKRLLRGLIAVMIGLLLVNVAALYAARRVVPRPIQAGTIDGRGA